MNISIMENGTEIRQAFIKKFTMTWEEFQIRHKEWIDSLTEKNFTVTHEERYLWELMDYCSISFSKSLELLRSLTGNIYVMSESESTPGHHEFEIDGAKHKNCVLKTNVKELADLIEYEWNEGWRLAELDIYLTHTILPSDIYVFDESMEHLLVLTHENDHWELEVDQPMVAAASRFCMIYGFEFSEDVTYDMIKSLLNAELTPNSSLEIEISYSSPLYFRQFIISKWTNEDNTGYNYWFDFESNTNYTTWEEVENARVFNNLSLKEVAKLPGVRFDIISTDGNSL